MAKVNWYIAAKASENEDVKELLIQYEKAKDKEEKKTLRDKMIVILTPNDNTAPAEPTQPEEKIEAENIDDKSPEEKAFKIKINKIKEFRKEKEKLEHSRLKHSSYDENKELNAKIKVIDKQIVAVRVELRNDRINKKAEEMRKNGLVSSIRVKQVKILKLLKDGISFSNITKHSDGVSLNEIVQVIDNNQDFMYEMEKINKKLPLIWLRWKQKFAKVDR